MSDLGKGAGWLVAGGVVALRGGRHGRLAAAASAAGMFAAIGLVQGPLKHSFRRRRPFRHRLAVVVGPEPADSSFPSGHTAGSFAAAAALGTFYPGARPLLLALASGVGVSRVYLGHHFPSDVLAGAGLGWLVGTLGARAVRRRPALRGSTRP